MTITNAVLRVVRGYHILAVIVTGVFGFGEGSTLSALSGGGAAFSFTAFTGFSTGFSVVGVGSSDMGWRLRVS